MDEEGSAIFSVIIIGLTYFSSCRLCLLPSTTKEGRSKKKGENQTAWVYVINFLRDATTGERIKKLFYRL